MNKTPTKNKKFLITGGAGFLGSHMCDLLLAEGAKVICVDDLSNGKLSNIAHLKNNKFFQFYKKNVNYLDQIKLIFAKEKPDYVMHYAAMVGVKKTSERPLEVFKDIEGIKNIAELSKQHRIKKVLFTSSSEVYGEPAKLPISEDDTFNSKWPYGLVKILGEQYFLAYYEKYGIPVTIVRNFNVYGPRQDFGDSGFVVSVFLKNALTGKALEIYGDGEQTRDFVYVDDNIRLTLKAFLDDKVNGRPMNIGSGRSISILELAKEVKKLIPEVKIVLKPSRIKGEIKYRTPDVSFMKKMLKDEPEVKLKDGISKTLEYLRSCPKS
jgi:UDP-glucose 4-epimerase